ncbi:hypothetical protein, unknown function [Leishmania tarentolae]|uniref:Transmembrane protein n=1 Tax=Leishmania tarentolae TaxID=5689 RepID=A0A640KLM1_LEITA|nr:hypothetical protein, unknown function [Leishmania tarentolae]
MALSYHIVLSLFLIFSFTDVVLISVRTLVSRRYHSLTLCYALMAVQESILLFELIAVLGQVISTYLVTASMWAQTASLLGAFTPLWLLRAFLTAFSVIYKDILLLRWSSAVVSTGAWGFLSDASRAWRSRGYGAVVSLDITCVCFYYLSAVYVMAYLSEKSLYVPYHQRRWRHLQMERALTAASTTAVAGEENREAARRKRRRQEQQGGARSAEGDGGDGALADYPTVMPLTRTPSFRQWEAVLAQQQQQQQKKGNRKSTTSNDGLTPLRAGKGESQRESLLPNTTGASWKAANPVQSPFHLSAGVRHGEKTSDSRTDASELISNTVTAVAKAQGAAQQHRNRTAPALRGAVTAVATTTTNVGSSKQRQSAPLVANLPPLKLQRRFSISNSAEEERRLHQFATTFVEHGYTSAQSQTSKLPPEMPLGKSHMSMNSGVSLRSGTPCVTETPTVNARDASYEELDSHSPVS